LPRRTFHVEHSLGRKERERASEREIEIEREIERERERERERGDGGWGEEEEGGRRMGRNERIRSFLEMRKV